MFETSISDQIFAVEDDSMVMYGFIVFLFIPIAILLLLYNSWHGTKAINRWSTFEKFTIFIFRFALRFNLIFAIHLLNIPSGLDGYSPYRK